MKFIRYELQKLAQTPYVVWTLAILLLLNGILCAYAIRDAAALPEEGMAAVNVEQLNLVLVNKIILGITKRGVFLQPQPGAAQNFGNHFPIFRS